MLPWSNLGGESHHEFNANIKQKMLDTSIAELCKGLPAEIQAYMECCNELKYDQMPEYKKYIALFQSCLDQQGKQVEEAKSRQEPASAGLRQNKRNLKFFHKHALNNSPNYTSKTTGA